MAIARRYAIYLPLTSNEEQRKYRQTIQELLAQFGGISGMRPEASISLFGYWMAGQEVYEDQIITYVVYSIDINTGDAFMRPYKEKLKRRFRQLEILLVAQLVELF